MHPYGRRTAGDRRHGPPCRPRLPGPTIWPYSKPPSSWRVTVAAPALPILDARTAADFGDPQIEHAGFAEAGKVADHMHRKSDRKCKEAAGDKECFGRHGRVDDEIAIGHPREHLRAGKGTEDRSALETHPELARRCRRLDAADDGASAEQDETADDHRGTKAPVHPAR